MKKIIIAAFAGTGKTYLANKYSNVIDIEPANYKWNSDNIITEKDKGKYQKIREEWPQNYVNEIIKEHNNYDIVLIGLNRDARNLLYKMGYEYSICFPSSDRKNEYIQRYKDRGNSEEFLNKQAYYFDNELPLLYKEPLEKMILEGNEFLEEYLLRNDFTLIKKENM